jgi:hypothetical protein
MTAGSLIVIALGILMAGLTVWALWPRSRPRPGPRNNWRQRGADEVEPVKTEAAGDFDSPYLVALDLSGD